jgi:hypothetical protein
MSVTETLISVGEIPSRQEQALVAVRSSWIDSGATGRSLALARRAQSPKTKRPARVRAGRFTTSGLAYALRSRQALYCGLFVSSNGIGRFTSGP